MMELKSSTTFRVRFNEVDSMNITWHGHYVTFFEDAREAFGKEYNLDYLTIHKEGYYAPLVDVHVEYKSPLIYGDEAEVEITYKDCEAAKIIFEYKIYNLRDGKLAAKGSTTQVFMDKDYRLVLYPPDFFIKWKIKNGLREE